MDRTISTGNVFLDIGFPPDEAAVLALTCDIAFSVIHHIKRKGLKAKDIGITKRRLRDLRRHKLDRFSIEELISIGVRAGMTVTLKAGKTTIMEAP